MGVSEYLSQFAGDRHVSHLRDTLIEKRLTGYDQCATDSWCWFEDVLTLRQLAAFPSVCRRAPLPCRRCRRESGIGDAGMAGRRADVEARVVSPDWLQWVLAQGSAVLEYDQQPLEAAATVSAAIEAYRVTHDRLWLSQAQKAFDWFMGRNPLGRRLCDPATGGCCDGLQEDRLNVNQGAESTLSFLMALAEMRLLGDTLAAFGDLNERSRSQAVAFPRWP